MTLIENYQAVWSTREIAKSIAYYLEMSDPANYPPGDRAKTVRAVNDILQGRSNRTVDGLLAELTEKGGSYYAGEIKGVRRDIMDFQYQRLIRDYPYTKSSGKQYKYRMNNVNPDRPLKIINQRLFDWAAKAGFPPDFFRESYFDHVTIYCMPEQADCNFSVFQDCTFAVCRISDVRLDGASIYGGEFHSCVIKDTTLFCASLADTHFYDSAIDRVSFQKAYLRRCNVLDCELYSVNFLNTTLDGCSFGRVESRLIRNLHTATITQGGATEAECRQNRESIYKALRPEPPAQESDRRAPAPER